MLNENKKMSAARAPVADPAGTEAGTESRLKVSIGGKVMLLTLLTGGITTLLLSTLTLFEGSNIKKHLSSWQQDTAATISTTLSGIAVEQAKKRLTSIVKLETAALEIYLDEMCYDVDMLADKLTEIATNPDKFLPKSLPQPQYDTVHDEEVYLNFHRLPGAPLDPEVVDSADRLANITELMESLKDSAGYRPAHLYVASKDGYTINLPLLGGNDRRVLKLPAALLDGTFKPWERTWYLQAKEQGQQVISDIYQDGAGTDMITISQPYFAGDRFAGVVARDVVLEPLFDNLKLKNTLDTASYFFISKDGRLIYSTRKDGLLASPNHGKTGSGSDGEPEHDLGPQAAFFAASPKTPKLTPEQTPALTPEQKAEQLIRSPGAAASEQDPGTQSEPQPLAQAPESMAAETRAAFMNMRQGRSGSRLIVCDGEEYLLAYSPVLHGQWSCGIMLPLDGVQAQVDGQRQDLLTHVDELVDNIKQSLRLTLLLVTLSLVLLFLGLIVLGQRRSRRFVRPFTDLKDGMAKISSGSLNQRLQINTGDEIEQLAQSFNHMTVQLKEQMDELRDITAEKERIETELAVATAIQGSMLPHQFPPPGGAYELYALSEPAREMGGDFYDFYLLDPEHLVLTMADVSGKGVPAALFMVIAKVILKNNRVSE